MAVAAVNCRTEPVLEVGGGGSDTAKHDKWERRRTKKTKTKKQHTLKCVCECVCECVCVCVSVSVSVSVSVCVSVSVSVYVLCMITASPSSQGWPTVTCQKKFSRERHDRDMMEMSDWCLGKKKSERVVNNDHNHNHNASSATITNTTSVAAP